MHAAVAKAKLADARMVAAELPTQIIARPRDREPGSSAACVTYGIVPVEDSTIPGELGEGVEGYVLLADLDRVAEPINEVLGAQSLEALERAVGRYVAEGGMQRVVSAGGADVGGVIAGNPGYASCHHSGQILFKRQRRPSRVATRRAEIERKRGLYSHQVDLKHRRAVLPLLEQRVLLQVRQDHPRPARSFIL